MNTTTSKLQKHQLSFPFLLRLLFLLMIFSFLSISLPNMGIAAKVYRTGIDPLPQPFEVYDTSTNTWTDLGTVDTGTQFAVSADQKLYMYNRATDMIQVYNPGTNTWTDVLIGPDIEAGYGNLEVTNDGEFILTYSFFNGADAKQMHYTVGGTWNIFELPDNASALADYDHATGKFVVGRLASEEVWKIDLSTFEVITFSNGASVTSEIRRFGEIYNNHWHSQFFTNPVTHYNLSEPPENSPLIKKEKTLPSATHYSATVDHDNGIFYVNTQGASEDTTFATWDPSTDTFNELSPAPSAIFGGHSTIAFVNQSSNQPPVADAGPDQTVECTSPSGATVTLDGSLSTDEDGDLLTYKWEWMYGMATGKSPTVIIPMNTSPTIANVTLEVSDGTETDTDDVFITVQDTTPPEITAPDNVSVEQTSSSGTSVTLGTPTVSDNCDANPAVTSDAPALFHQGNTTVTWTATDASGNFKTAKQTVTVVDTTAPDVRAKLRKKRGYFRVEFSAIDIIDTDPKIVSLLNGVSVTNGQLVKLKHKKKFKVNISDDDSSSDDDSNDNDKVVTFRGSSFTLKVTATDDSGNVGTGTDTFVFPSRHGDDGHSDDRELKKKLKNALKKKWRKRYSKDNSNGQREWWNWRKWRNWGI